MVDRYVTLQNVIDHLELDELNNTDDPKQRVVEDWITASEDEVDHLTGIRWDLHQIDNELISPDCQTNEFILSVRPLKRILSIYFQNGTEWSPDWDLLADDQYRIVNSKLAKFKTQSYYWMEESLRVTYENGIVS